MFLKFGGVWVSAPQEGVGGMRGGILFRVFGESEFIKSGNGVSLDLILDGPRLCSFTSKRRY